MVVDYNAGHKQELYLRKIKANIETASAAKDIPMAIQDCVVAIRTDIC